MSSTESADMAGGRRSDNPSDAPKRILAYGQVELGGPVSEVRPVSEHPRPHQGAWAEIPRRFSGDLQVWALE